MGNTVKIVGPGVGGRHGEGGVKDAPRFLARCPSGRSFPLSEGHSRTVRLGEEGALSLRGCRDAWV